MPEEALRMEQIAVAALYDERGETAWARPIIQGDAFRDVVLPGFGDDAHVVQFVGHPCAIRRGPDLVKRVTVAPVASHTRVEGGGQRGWDGHLKFMPLPDLHGDGRPFATRFEDVATAPSELLSLDRRIATLSNRGIYVLQQRLIKHYTRLTVDIPTLRKQAGPVLDEAEQEREWVETCLDGESITVETVREASLEFHAWLDSGEPSLRSLLEEDANRLDIRRQTKAEAVRRVRERRNPGRSHGTGHR